MSGSPKQTRFYLLVLLVMGSCIGSGIFINPTGVAKAIPHAGMLLPVWILGGLITLSGALSYGELAARFPQAGGVYVYLKEAYGSLAAFLFGWVVLMAVTSGAIAGLGLVFSSFLSVFFPMEDAAQKMVAVGLIVACTAVNIGGFSLGRQIAGLVTALKVMGIVGLIVAGLAFVRTPVAVDWSWPELGWDSLSPMLLGLVGVYWSYGGWHHLTYLSGEMGDARKRMGGAMLLGVLGVMAAYVMVNWAYLRALPLQDIIASKGVAADMMTVVFGEVGGKLLAGLVCISVAGSILIYTMSAPRIYFAMAADGIFFPALAKIHPKTGTPAFAIGVQSGWAIILLFLWGTFGNLVDYVTYTEAVFLVMAAAAVYIFRWRDKKAGRKFEGFKVPGYPITPLIYVVISGVFVLNGLAAKVELASAAAALFGVGLALFFWFRRGNVQQNRQ
ncbi:MAG: amino acid permease [Bacteroidetes bacterium]|nr:amino acid permease [Bacteroidota bacterium]